MTAHQVRMALLEFRLQAVRSREPRSGSTTEPGGREAHPGSGCRAIHTNTPKGYYSSRARRGSHQPAERPLADAPEPNTSADPPSTRRPVPQRSPRSRSTPRVTIQVPFILHHSSFIIHPSSFILPPPPPSPARPSPGPPESSTRPPPQPPPASMDRASLEQTSHTPRPWSGRSPSPSP